jgi:lysozyme family protein
MSEAFDRALSRVLTEEGGLVDDPQDPGGIAKFGISLRAHPELGRAGILGLTPERAAEIYRKYYWPLEFDELPPTIACEIFDHGVTAGMFLAIRLAQRACRAFGVHLTDDGKIGPATVQALQRAPAAAYIPVYRMAREGYYRAVAEELACGSRFLDGWLYRTWQDRP